MMKAAVGKSMAAFVIVEKKNRICYNSRKDATLMIRGSLTGDSKISAFNKASAARPLGKRAAEIKMLVSIITFIVFPLGGS